MTGIRMAQTRGGKKSWRGWLVSTKGCAICQSLSPQAQRWSKTYHQQRPDRVVEKHDGGGHEHGEANESVQLDPVSNHGQCK